RAREHEDFRESLGILTEKLWPEVPEIARNRALVTLRQMTAWAAARGRENEARRWINETVARVMPLDSLAAGYELYQSEAERFVRDEKPEYALRLLEQVPEAERPAELQQVAMRASFAAQRNALE